MQPVKPTISGGHATCSKLTSSLHEPETELASLLEVDRKLITFPFRVYAAILVPPTVAGSSRLRRAPFVEDPHTATGDGEVELVATQVAAGVGHLHQHLQKLWRLKIVPDEELTEWNFCLFQGRRISLILPKYIKRMANPRALIFSNKDQTGHQKFHMNF